MAEIRGVAYPHGQTLTAVNGGREVLAPNCSLDYVLHVPNVNSVSGGGFAVYFYFEVRRASDALRIEIRDAGNRPQSPFDFSFLLLDGRKIVAEDLDSHLGANASRKHVDAVADRLGPDVGDARRSELLIQPLQDRLLGRPSGPLVLGFEIDHGLSHVHWRGINCAFRAADLADNALDERIFGNDLVLPAKNLGRLGEGNAGVGNGHEQGSLFIERRHELGADRSRQPEGRSEYH